MIASRPLVIVSSLCASACGAGSDVSEPTSARLDADAEPASTYTPYTEPLVVDGKAWALTADPGAATLRALAACACAPGLVEAVAKRLTVAPGALPQVLMPPVRAEIRANETLQSLLSLPLGLGGLLAGAFVNDEKVATEVRAGLADKLSRASPGGTRLPETLPFRFDGFPHLASQGADPGTWDLTDQAARWSLVLSGDGLWAGDQPMALGDHGWQLLETMRLLVEWRYLFGLETAPDGGVYGGLTVDPAAPDAPVRAFDPRVDQGGRIVTGAYAVRFEGETALDQALRAREQWAHIESPISLSEQATLWRIAAQAFRRLRPENRGRTSGLFGAGEAIFPAEAHRLPLAFLPGMQLLLADIVQPDTRVISATYQSATPAGLMDLVRMAGALAAWVGELGDLSGADLDDETAARLAESTPRLVAGAQLAVQAILRDFTVDVPTGLGLRLDQSSSAAAAEAGEVLVTLLELERTLLPSPLLKTQICGLYHWYAAEFLAPAAGAGGQGWTAAAALWGYAALVRFGGYDSTSPTWLGDGRALLQSAVSALSLAEGP